MMKTMRTLLDTILEGVEGVLFDLDGVLLDTERIYTEATRRILGPLADRFDFQLKSQMMGRAPQVAAKILLDAVGSPLTPAEYNEIKRPILRELFRSSVPKAGAPELVAALRERGLPLAVATSSDRDYWEIKTGHHSWFSHFQTVVCGNDPHVSRYKPAPDIFLEAARQIRVSPARCIVFEDSAAGVEAARRARVKRIIAIPDPALDRSLLRDASLIIQDYSELFAPAPLPE